jgi:putative tryptophan/tyrosine transport system substrate-binding protein
LARPGGNLTGFMSLEASITVKWLAMLKEIAPGLVRAALVANPKNALGEVGSRGRRASWLHTRPR